MSDADKIASPVPAPKRFVAKLRLTSIQSVHQLSGKQVLFTPQYDEKIPEDARFARYTPSGEVRLYIDNPAVTDNLVLGQDYYVDFTPTSRSVTPNTGKGA